MSALMEIIIKAIDKSSDVAKKVENNLKGMGDKASKALDKASQSGDRFTGAVVKVGQSGISAYAQLSQKQQKYINGLNKTQGMLDRMGLSGTKMGNAVLRGYDLIFNGANRVRSSVESLKQKIESTTVGSKLITGFNSVSTTVSNVGSKIKTAIGTGLDSAKTKVQNLNNSMGELGTAVTSAFGALGMGSIYDATIGLGMVREQMTTLMSATMGSGAAAKSFVSYLDQMTNNSLVSLNDLGNAMSKIKMSTGLTNDQLKLIAPTVNDIGQRALLMGKSTGEAQDLMVASFRGLNGEFDMLKTNFGITKQSLVDAGWSGAATDVEGYNAALQKVLAKGGSMDGMLQSTTGQIQLVKKGFSTAGRQIGEAFLPAIKVILSFMVSLKQTNPLVFKLMIVGAALISAFALLLPVMASIIGSFKSFLIFLGLVEGGENATTLATIRDTIAKKASAVASKAAAVANGVLTAANTAYTFATSGSVGATVASTASRIAHGVASGAAAVATGVLTAAQWLLNAALNANPIGIVIIAIVALVAILAVLYNKNETVRNAINALWNGLKVLGGYIVSGLMAAWNAVGGALSWIWGILVKVGSFIAGTFIAAWVSIRDALSPITSALGNLWTALNMVWSAFSGGQAAQANSTFNQIGNVINVLWAVISSALLPVFQTLYGVLVQVATFIGGFFSAVWTTLSGSIMAVINYISLFINSLAQLLSGQITFSQFATQIWNGFKTMLLSILMSVILGVGSWAAQLLTKGKNAAVGFVTGIISYIASLPGRVWAYLMYTLQRIQNFANSARERARSAASQMVSAFASYLSSLPGKMYTWGKNAINSFINAVINSIPGLRSALNMVSSLFPHSPPKEGPLSTIKPENIYSWGSTLGDALTSGVNDSTGSLFSGIKTAIDTKVDVTTKMPDVSENMGNTQVLTEQTTKAIDAANMTKNGVTTAYNSMGTTVTSSLTSMVNNDKSAWLKIKGNTDSQLNSIKNSTKQVTGQMISAWDTMKNGIVNSAEKIRSQSSGKISNLSVNIRTFYDRLTHPTKWFAGPGPTHRRVMFSTNFAGPARSSKELLDSFLINESPCTNCYAGGWSSSTPNNNKIRDELYNYNVTMPDLNGLKVGDFSNTTNPLLGNMRLFEAVAEKLIAPTSYDFYYNGRYGNLEALQRGRFNCWDGAEIMVGLANAMGIPAHMIHGRWGNIGHMAAMVGGKIFDTTQRQNRGVWRGSPGVSFAGPGPVGYTRDENSENKDSVVISGEFTIVHDLKNIPSGLDESLIAELINNAADDENFFKKLLNNRNFLNALVKNLKIRDNRINRGGAIA
jgi:Transglutaminase-like enzymes, putative cysteine proteases